MPTLAPVRSRPAPPPVIPAGPTPVLASFAAPTAGAIAGASAAVGLALTGVSTLAAGAAVPAGVFAALAGLGVSAVVAAAVTHLVLAVIPATYVSLPAGPAVRTELAHAPLYRAAYLVHAALRVAHRVGAGATLGTALHAERRFFTAHLGAQRRRVNAARRIDLLAGHAWLRWQLGDTKTHTPVCRAAAGHVFPARVRPLHGWPGSAHPGCRCTAVPGHAPRPGQRTVNQVIAGLVAAGED